jgi:predicted nucleotidyltransferase component of viral defense system
LDFTLLGKKIVADEKLIKKIIEKAARNSGIKFHFQNRKIQKSDGKEQAYEIKIKYWGANHKPNQKPLPPSRWQTQIKLDISFTEKLLLPAEQKPILHEYSDNSLISEIIPTYSLIEVLGEKLRSLIQRNRPRDIYDLNYLSNLLPEDSSTSIKNILFEKAKSKGIKINDTHDFVNLIKGRTNKRAWQSSLGNHLPAGELPDFDKVYNKLRQFIEKILNS